MSRVILKKNFIFNMFKWSGSFKYAVNICKQFGSRSGRTFCRAWPESNPIKCRSYSEFEMFDILLAFLKELKGKGKNEISQQTTRKE